MRKAASLVRRKVVLASKSAIVCAALATAIIAGSASSARAQIPFACGPILFGGVTCTTIFHGALIATGTSYTAASAFTLNLEGGLNINSPTTAITATSALGATVNVDGGVNVNSVLAGFAVTGATATVNVATGAKVNALGAGYVVTGLGLGPLDGAVANVGGATTAVGAGIIATSLAGSAVVNTTSTGSINAGGAGIIATGGFDVSVRQDGSILAGLEGIIASVVGVPDVFSSNIISNASIIAGLDGILVNTVFGGATVRANSDITALLGTGIQVNAVSGGTVTIFANGAIDASRHAIRVDAAGTSSVDIRVENTATLKAGSDAAYVSTLGNVNLDVEGAVTSTNGSAITIANGANVSAVLEAPLTAGVDGISATGSGAVVVNQTSLAPIVAGRDGLKAGSTGGAVTIVHNGALTVGRDAIVLTGTGGASMSTVTSNLAIDAPRNGILATNVNGPLTIDANASVLARTGRGIDVTGGGALGSATINVNAALAAQIAGVRVDTVAGSALNVATGASISAASDLAIEAPEGPLTVTNNGLITGFVRLSQGNDTFNNNSSLSWVTHSSGKAGSTSTFGTGSDTLNNTGRIVAARSAAIAEAVSFNGLENFNNGSASATGAGLTTLQDGAPNDSLTTSGTFTGVGNSRLAVDSFLGPPGSTSDRLIVGTATAGRTGVLVNNTNPAPGSYNPVGIDVIDVSSGTTAAQHFFLPNGRIDRGLFFYDLLLRPDNVHVLAGIPDREAFEMPRIVTGTQEFWHQTAGVWLDRQADLRDFMRVRASGHGSDGPNVTPGIWARALGGISRRQETQRFGLFNGQYDFDVGYLQQVYGFIGGIDGGREEVFNRNDAWLVGVLAGYVGSRLDFRAAESSTEARYSGATVGGYTTYINRAFYIDALVKADLLKLNYTAGSLQPFGGSGEVSAKSIGGRIDSGFRHWVAERAFIEPLSTVSFVSTEIEDLFVSGARIAFGDNPSLRARLGLRGGGDIFRSPQFRITTSLTASVWHEFLAKNEVTIVNAGPDLIVTDRFNKTFGELAGAVDFIDLGGGFSGHVKGDIRLAEGFWAGRVNIGGRVRW